MTRTTAFSCPVSYWKAGATASKIITSKVEPAADYWADDVKSAARCRLLNRWPRKPGDDVVLFLMSGKLLYERGNILNEYNIKQLLNSTDLGGCYPSRPSASMDNTLLVLQNSSYPNQPHSIYNCSNDSALLEIVWNGRLMQSVMLWLTT